MTVFLYVCLSVCLFLYVCLAVRLLVCLFVFVCPLVCFLLCEWYLNLGERTPYRCEISHSAQVSRPGSKTESRVSRIVPYMSSYMVLPIDCSFFLISYNNVIIFKIYYKVYYYSIKKCCVVDSFIRTSYNWTVLKRDFLEGGSMIG